MSKTQRSDVSRVAATYARYSSDLQNDRSILQQQEECHAAAAKNGHEILPELQYQDQAVSGTKLNRTGLDAMLADAAAGKFGALYVYSLSRIGRESLITLQLVKRLHHRFNIRVFCLLEGIDTANPNWTMHVHLMAMQHERFITDLAAGVLRGQADNVRQNLSVGDYPLGYKTVAVSDSAGRGRQRKIPRIYQIDPDTSLWVKRIFDWFTIERRSIAWIVRELNKLQAPKDHRATSKMWRHPQVINVLRNAKAPSIKEELLASTTSVHARVQASALAKRRCNASGPNAWCCQRCRNACSAMSCGLPKFLRRLWLAGNPTTGRFRGRS